jgi:hypothetical protein
MGKINSKGSTGGQAAAVEDGIIGKCYTSPVRMAEYA